MQLAKTASIVIGAVIYHYFYPLQLLISLTELKKTNEELFHGFDRFKQLN